MSSNNQNPQYPETVIEAVQCLIMELPISDKIQIAAMDEADLAGLHFSLGTEIRNQCGLWAGNKKLMASCRALAQETDLSADDASMVIIRELWKLLRQQTPQLRVVK
jgi:hypothetical protein